MEMESTDATMVGDSNQLIQAISHVISLTTPRDACVSSLVSRTFRSAADSDATWQRFLPSDYTLLLNQAIPPLEYASKKDLYFQLCEDHVLIDDGKMSFGLDKPSGAKCYMISARALHIEWGHESRYWRWIALPDSRFAEDAELLAVCWLEIHGKMERKILTPLTAYAAYFVFKLAKKTWGLHDPLQETNIKLDGDVVSQHFVCLHPERRQISSFTTQPEEAYEIGGNVFVPVKRGDGWMEIEMGEFYSGDGVDDGVVDMSLKEVKRLLWKKGLIIQSIEVRPKH